MIYCTHSNPKEKENSKIAPLEMAIDWRLRESESVRYQHNGDGLNEALYHWATNWGISYIHTHIHTLYIYTHIYTHYVYIYVYIHIIYMSIYIYVCMYIYICDLVKVGV